MTDFRALCAELLDEFVYHTDWSDAEELKDRARAALADGPAVPTVMEIVELADEIEAAGLGQVDLVRAALTRWGNPAPQPPAEGEVAAVVAWLREIAQLWEPDAPRAKQLFRAADLLERLAPQPPAEGEVEGLVLRVQRLEAMRETEKAALLDAFKQIDDLKHRIDFHYMKIYRLEDALPVPGQEVVG